MPLAPNQGDWSDKGDKVLIKVDSLRPALTPWLLWFIPIVTRVHAQRTVVAHCGGVEIRVDHTRVLKEIRRIA